jgi:hypothetical protein
LGTRTHDDPKNEWQLMDKPVELGPITKLLNANRESQAMEKTQGGNRMVGNDEEVEEEKKDTKTNTTYKVHEDTLDPALGKSNPL